VAATSGEAFEAGGRGRAVPPPEARLRVGGCDMLLLGTVAGFVPDGERVQSVFAAFQPDAVALGVPAEDVAALDALAQGGEAALMQPDDLQVRLLELLARFGATRIPSPDLQAAHTAAKAAGIPLVALDMDDQEHSAAYVQRVKVRHLWRAPVRDKRLLELPFGEAQDAYELAAAWDREANSTKPLRQLEALREEAMAQRLREAASRSRRLLALIPVPRLAGVLARLQP
jgi:hypothetical protein